MHIYIRVYVNLVVTEKCYVCFSWLRLRSSYITSNIVRYEQFGQTDSYVRYRDSLAKGHISRILGKKKNSQKNLTYNKEKNTFYAVLLL